MGWWWKSSPKDEALQNNGNSANHNAAPQQQPPSPPKQSTPDEQAESFFASLERQERNENNRTGLTTPSSSITSTPSPNSNPPTETPSLSPSSSSPSSSPIAPESLYPDSMSCRSAFDYAFFCQSFGGQFVNVYRYGQLRSCSEHWDNFWLCMKTRTYPDEERKQAIRDHYRRKAIKYKTGPSSEDVWDVRLEPVKGFLEGNFEELERVEGAKVGKPRPDF